MGYGRERLGAAALVVVAALALASGTAAGAKTLTKDQRHILYNAVWVDGFLNADIHRAFWAALPAELRNDPAKVRALVEAEDDADIRAMRVSRAEWESIKASKAAGTIIETPGYVAEKRAMFEEVADDPRLAKAVDEMVAEGMARFAAAAAGRPVRVDGEEKELTSKLIETRLSGIEAALFRLERLLDPVWSTTLRDYHYPEARLRIRWEGPFVKDTESDPIVLTYRYSKGEKVLVMLNSLQTLHHDLAELVQELGDTADLLGLTDTVLQKGPWHGRPGGTMSGRSPHNYVSVRSAAAPEIKGAYFLWASSPESAAAADKLRAQLEKAITFE